ncbi:LexA family transcriptional regulator [Pantoea ananatis]|uniref:LexA family protein n=1 Tax=Pantoea ananas TaxID=553 RepID=UPI001FF46600|nr:LexA family transcriptional regulator [Pantoea ananatis]MCK0552536.1 LexA family transcriptional regulator [Pantoea ananatis]
MEQLTNTQQRTINFIQSFIRENGLSPTIAEIAEGMGWKSPNSAVNHINALERKGYLKIKRATGRGITLPAVSYEHDSLALDTATRINDMLHVAFRDGWPEVRIKAAIQVEVISALNKGVV